MEQRHLGTSGLTVSAIGLGCMGMSQSYGAGDDEESVRTIHRALDLGVTYLDTADVYGQGSNEKLVGQAIRERRQDVVLGTKFGLIPSPSGPATSVDGRPDRVRPSCEASLRRLGVDVIDLYYLHRVDPNTPIEDTVGAMSELVREGKVRFLGLSEAGPQTIRRANRIHPIAALQSEYSLWSREPEAGGAARVSRTGHWIRALQSPWPRFPVRGCQGDGEAGTERRAAALPRFQEENLKQNIVLVQRLEAMARSKGCSPPQLALAWLLAKGDKIVPIPGTKRRRYLEENVGAMEIALSGEDLAALDEAFPPESVAGERYPPESMRLIEGERV